MKKPSLVLFGAIAIYSLSLKSAEAQMSPSHLTHRIAPQPAPAPNNAPGVPGPVVAQPVQPTVRSQPLPDLEKANAEFRKRRAGQSSGPAEAQPQTEAQNQKDTVPLVVECKKVQPDPEQFLQNIGLTLKNTTQKAVSRITMRLIYFADDAERLKEWTTRRELEPPLPGKSTIEMTQPAYFMPLVTKRVKVEIESIRFSDGTEWTPPEG